MGAIRLTAPAADPNAIPDGPTLGDWRVALTLWPMADGTGDRLADVLARVATLKAAGHPLAKIAAERVEYSNNVFRAELVALQALFGFTAAEVDESLWRAHRVSLGDLSGTWPLA